MVQSVNPYLNFAGNTLEAFTFYRSVIGGEFPMVLRYKDFPGNMGAPDADADRIAHIALPIGSSMLMGTDVTSTSPGAFVVGTNSYIVLNPDSAGEAKQLFDGLSAGGHAVMPLQSTEWAEAYGILVDRYGVQWMVNFEGRNAFRP